MGWGGARGLLVSLGPNHVLAGVEVGGKGDGGGRRGGGGAESIVSLMNEEILQAKDGGQIRRSSGRSPTLNSEDARPSGRWFWGRDGAT